MVMENTDLMVGDFVYKRNYGNETEMVIGQIDADDLYYGRTQYFKPIPLSKELLEKVGFSYDENINKYFLTDKDTYDNLIVLYKLSNGFAMTTEGMTIGLQNVHELQHLFRLCGICFLHWEKVLFT